MKQLKNLKLLELFINTPLFTSVEVGKQDVPRYALAYLDLKLLSILVCVDRWLIINCSHKSLKLY